MRPWTSPFGPREIRALCLDRVSREREPDGGDATVRAFARAVRHQPVVRVGLFEEIFERSRWSLSSALSLAPRIDHARASERGSCYILITRNSFLKPPHYNLSMADLWPVMAFISL